MTASSASGSGRARRKKPAGAADRVARSHAQLRPTLRLVLLTAGVAAGVAAFAVARDWPQPRWVPLHLFLAGSVVLAISGVSQMLTVTWSAAPAPPARAALLQRCAILLGALGIAVGRVNGWDRVVEIAGTAYVAGLVGLAVLLIVTVRRGVERRFDAAVASYVAAVVAGLAGVGIGIAMAVDAPTVGLRSAHLALNLLGLVGLVIGGTLPFFAATVGRSKMLPGATPKVLVAILGWQVSMLVVIVATAWGDAARTGAVIGFVGYALGVVATITRLPRPTKRQMDWSGPRLVGLWAGATWWTVAVVASAVDVASDRQALAGRWLLVLVIAGYAQILWGSLAYLLPVLRGGGHQVLGEGFATTRSWPGLVAVNVAGLAFAVDVPPVALVAASVWVIDGGFRAARVGTTRATRPDARTGVGSSDGRSEG